MAYDRLKFASLNKTRAGCAALSQINTTLSLDHHVVQLPTENLLAISLVKEKVIRFTLKEGTRGNCKNLQSERNDDYFPRCLLHTKDIESM